MRRSTFRPSICRSSVYHPHTLCRGGPEPIGNIQPRPALFCPAYSNPVHQQPYELAAFVERLLRVPLYLLEVLFEGHEPRLRGGCYLPILLCANEVSIDRGDQELEVLYLIRNVCEVGLKFLLVQYFPASVEPYVAILLGLF